MQRIEQFLDETEVPEWASSMKTAESGSHPLPHHKIGFNHASFEWPGLAQATVSNARFRLGPLEIYFPQGKLTLVTGATGSGKSALLAALLGEMHCTSGSVYMDKMNHLVAYCAQNPCQLYILRRTTTITNNPVRA
jgi:ABC-type multidrug transport system fused ATPase/permease subunit